MYYEYKGKRYYFSCLHYHDTGESIPRDRDITIEDVRRNLKCAMRYDIMNDYALNYILSNIKLTDIRIENFQMPNEDTETGNKYLIINMEYPKLDEVFNVGDEISIPLIQRKMRFGYAKSKFIFELLEAHGRLNKAKIKRLIK